MQTTGDMREDVESGALALVPGLEPPQKRQKTVLTVSASLMLGDAGAVSAPSAHCATEVKYRLLRACSSSAAVRDPTPTLNRS